MRISRHLSILLILAVLLAACAAPAATPTAAPTVAPTSAPVVAAATEVPQVAPTAVPTVAPEPTATIAPTEEQKPAESELTVFAAASLTESFTEMGKEFEAAHPGAKVVFNFAGSQQLRAQLEQGARADVFASANNKEMNAAIESSLVVSGTQQVFARNRLVVVYPKDNPGKIETLADLAKPGLKLVVADKAVPVGQYTLDMLGKMSQDAEYGAVFSETVQSNVVSRENDVKAVVAKVRLGEADAGVVYSTDVTADAAADVTPLTIPDKFNQIATYPIAVLSEAPQPELGKEFVDYVLSDAGQELLAGYGFILPQSAAAAATSAGPITVTDALGREVTFQKPPQRIVMSGKALFMVADALYLFPEASSRIAAIGSTAQSKLDFIATIDPNYASKTVLAKDAGAEQIAAMQPDAVILKSSTAGSLGAPLETLGIPVVYVSFETPELYQSELVTLGKILGNEARAEELAAKFQKYADDVTSVTASLTDDQKPNVLVLYYSEKDGAVAFSVPPLSWMQSMMVQMAGGKVAWEEAQLGDGWTKVGLEQIAAWDPDQVYIIAYFNPVSEVVDKLKADGQWQALRAVKEGQIYGFAGDYYSWDQPDPRWVLGMTWLATKVQPDLFKDVDVEQVIKTFYGEMYGLTDDQYAKVVQPNLFGDVP